MKLGNRKVVLINKKTGKVVIVRPTTYYKHMRDTYKDYKFYGSYKGKKSDVKVWLDILERRPINER